MPASRMTALNLTPRLQDPDALFAALVAAHDGLPPAASRRLDAKLVLLLANHIGDDAVVLDALRTAQATTEPTGDQPTGDQPGSGQPTQAPAEAPA